MLQKISTSTTQLQTVPDCVGARQSSLVKGISELQVALVILGRKDPGIRRTLREKILSFVKMSFIRSYRELKCRILVEIRAEAEQAGNPIFGRLTICSLSIGFARPERPRYDSRMFRSDARAGRIQAPEIIFQRGHFKFSPEGPPQS